MAKSQRAAAVTSALGVTAAAMAFLNKPEVKEMLRTASEKTKEWAASIKRRRGRRALHPDSDGENGFVKRRVGAGALVRRLDELSAAVSDVASLEPTMSDRLGAQVRELRIRIRAAAKLSRELRRPKLTALEAELDALEHVLAEAIS